MSTERDAACAECGMVCSPGEFHPYAACLMFRGCHDGDVVRTNLAALRGPGEMPEAGKDSPATAGQDEPEPPAFKPHELLGNLPDIPHEAGPIRKAETRRAPKEGSTDALREALKEAIDGFEEHVHFVKGSLMHVTVQKWKRIAESGSTDAQDAELTDEQIEDAGAVYGDRTFDGRGRASWTFDDHGLRAYVRAILATRTKK
jgi:hypothetical protein